MFRVEMLPARQGDCLWIEYGDASKPHRVLVDGGPPPTWDVLKPRVVPKMHFDLVVGSHVDIDHLHGLLRTLTWMPDDVQIDDVWHNGWDELPHPRDMLGAVEGEMLSAIIERRKLPHNAAFGGGAVSVGKVGEFPTVSLDGGMQLTLLLPATDNLDALVGEWEDTVREHGLDPGDAEAALERWQEQEKLPPDVLGDEKPDPKALARLPVGKDDSKPNGSSVAFVAKYDGKRCLFTGDAHPDDLARAVQALARAEKTARLEVDATKLSHHGSGRSTNNELIQALDCPRYLVSSSGAHYGHPKVESISRVIVHGGSGVELLFNYRTKFNEMWDDAVLKDKHDYKTVYPPGDTAGLVVDI